MEKPKQVEISKRGISLIKHFESLHDGDAQQKGAQPKMDPVGIWTIGYGHALLDPKNPKSFLRGAGNKKVAYNLYPELTEEEAVELLLMDLYTTYIPITKKMIEPYVLVQLNEDQFSALVSFTFNCGTSYINRFGIRTPYAIWANLHKLFTPSENYSMDKFQAYWEKSVIRGNGKILNGLIRRRKSEAYLFRYSILKV